MFRWDPRQILYLCKSNILKHVQICSCIYLFPCRFFSISWTRQKCSRYKNVDITKNKTVSCVFKGVKGQKILTGQSTVLVSMLSRNVLFALYYLFVLLTLWPYGFNYMYLAAFVKKARLREKMLYYKMNINVLKYKLYQGFVEKWELG